MNFRRIENDTDFILHFCLCCREIDVGDVVLYGLIISLPLIESDNLLKVPSISLCYYKLASSLCKQHTQCIFRSLNQDQYSIFLLVTYQNNIKYCD